MYWTYEREDFLICPHCDSSQSCLMEDLYGIGESSTQWHTCEHCGRQFKWQIASLKFNSAVE